MSVLALFAAKPSQADSTSTHQRTVTALADGIYEIRHQDAPDTFPQGNTVVIIGESSVLVVDSCYLPSSAREDIAQIRQWTDKPVRYLLNTHHHVDHNLGNEAYSEAFPGLTIVAHTETAKMMALRHPSFIAEFQDRAARFRQGLESGKDANGKILTEGEKEELKTAIAGNAVVWKEFQELKLKNPDVTFDSELDVDLGGREVQLKFLGRGNTVGDVVAFLPKEKILVTGDLVDHPVPYLGGGFPVEQVATLGRLEQLGAETIVPGHGEVLHGSQGNDYVRMERDLIAAVLRAMDAEIARTAAAPSRRLEEIRKAVLQNVDMSAWRQKFAGDDQDSRDFFDGFAIGGLVNAAHAQLWPR